MRTFHYSIIILFLISVAVSVHARTSEQIQAASAAFVVSNTNDSGAGSLRQAISDVTPGGTITFSGNLHIKLDSQLTISKNMTIDAGSRNITIDAQKKSRVFNIGPDANVTLIGLTITGGFAVPDNHPNDPFFRGSEGGGIHTEGTLTVEKCTISGNNAYKGGGIYAYYVKDYTNNPTPPSKILTLKDSIISDNSACGTWWYNPGGRYETHYKEGGGIYVRNYTYTYPNDVPLTIISNCTISGNIAGNGGGFHGGYITTIMYCKIFGNKGIDEHDGSGRIEGGGICCGSQSMTIINCSITKNTLTSSNQWAPNTSGGGIHSQSDRFLLRNSTVSGNSAGGPHGSGGGIYSRSPEWAILYNSIIAQNTANGTGNGEGPDICNGLRGHSTDTYCNVQGYYNLTTFTGWNGGASNNVPYNSGSPLFVNAANDNYRLAAGSQAIDKGNNTYATDGIIEYELLPGKPLTADLDGNKRIVNGVVDIGAYEYDRSDPAKSATTLR